MRARRKAIGFLPVCYKLTDVAPECTSVATTPDYAASMLCLFEIHYNLNLDKEIKSEIFATWMPWIYDACKGEYFRKVWKEDLNKHYTRKFRVFMNSLMKIIVDDKIDESKKEDAFYEKASKLLNNDPIIKEWLKNLNEDA